MHHHYNMNHPGSPTTDKWVAAWGWGLREVTTFDNGEAAFRGAKRKLRWADEERATAKGKKLQ